VRQAGTTLSLRVTSVPLAAGEAFQVDDVGIELIGGGGPSGFTLDVSTVGSGSVTKTPDQPTYTAGSRSSSPRSRPRATTSSAGAALRPGP
jgi:hypothetical protein